MKPSFSTFSFGCRVNQAEIETIKRRFIQAGFEYNEAKPDFHIINTCAVTSKAEREVRQYIYNLYKKYPKTKVIITGCAATYWKNNHLYPNLPVDIVISNSQKEALVKIILNKLHKEHTNNITNPGGSKGCHISKYHQSSRIIVKIQDGCQRFCSYCIVPYLRGKPKSKRISEIINEIKSHSNAIKEVILTAINTEAFGYNTGEKLTGLLKAIIDKTDIPRISLGSIHPLSLTGDFFQFYEQHQGCNRLVNFFHIPIQSGSNRILKLMNRGYTTEDMKNKLNRLKTINPNALIATDIIVGFPGEIEADFEETYKFLQQSPISKVHIFRFSKRCGTSAYNLVNQLIEPPAKKKIERSKKLSLLSRSKYRQILLEQIGRTSDALFLNKKTNGYQIALLDNQLPVFIKTDKNLNGEIKNVEIIGLKKDNLFGKIV